MVPELRMVAADGWFLLDAMREHGDPIPEEQTLVRLVEVPAASQD